MTQIFAGTGTTERTNNPANRLTIDISTLPGTLSDCDAVKACANTVVNYNWVDLSFDLHYTTSNASWECVGYFDHTAATSDFNITNPDVANASGYEVRYS
jgi:hypothetical protein